MRGQQILVAAMESMKVGTIRMKRQSVSFYSTCIEEQGRTMKTRRMNSDSITMHQLADQAPLVTCYRQTALAYTIRIINYELMKSTSLQGKTNAMSYAA